MDSSIIVLFGAAERGDFETPYYCKSLSHLFEFLGHPPKETQGIHLAVQSLTYGRPCLYFRVQEEGVSIPDYQFGLRFLHKAPIRLPPIEALGLPGVGLREIIEESLLICREHHSLLLMSEKDLYDCLTDRPTIQ